MKTPLTLALLAFSAPALAQDAPAEKGLPPQPLIAFRKAALAQWAPDPKDAALKAALGMIDLRLKELPRELPPDAPHEAFDGMEVLVSALASPARFSIVFNPSSNAGGAFGYGVVLTTMFAAEGDADRLQGLVEGGIAQSGEQLPKRSREEPGMREMRTPGGKVMFGPRKFEPGTGYEVRFGTVTDADGPFAAIPEPSIAGLTPFISGTFDFGALTPIANFGQMALNQKAAEGEVPQENVVDNFASVGVVGDKAMKGTFEFGHTADAMRSRVRVQNAIPALGVLGIDKGRLGKDDFAAIPADANTASVGLLNLEAIQKLIDGLRAQKLPVDEYLGQFTKFTGVDFEKDILKQVGGVSAIYSSEVTGGGGLLSTVVLLGVKDSAKLISARAKIASSITDLLGQEADKGPDHAWARYIRPRAWQVEGVPAMTMTFPGVPIPLEISSAITDKWAIIALSPQALTAAVRQATGKGGKDILSRPDWRLLDLNKQEVISVSFSDPARNIRDGYGIAAAFGMAVSNAMRSPFDPKRDPGMVTPMYNDLIAGVKPSVSVAYREGQTLVLDSICDRSWLVNIAATAGVGSSWGSLSSLLSAVGAANENAQLKKMMSLLPTSAADRDLLARVPLVQIREAVQGPLAWPARAMEPVMRAVVAE